MNRYRQGRHTDTITAYRPIVDPERVAVSVGATQQYVREKLVDFGITRRLGLVEPSAFRMLLLPEQRLGELYAHNGEITNPQQAKAYLSRHLPFKNTILHNRSASGGVVLHRGPESCVSLVFSDRTLRREQDLLHEYAYNRNNARGALLDIANIPRLPEKQALELGRGIADHLTYHPVVLSVGKLVLGIDSTR